MKKIFIVALSLICLSLAGCFQVKADLIVTGDGAVVQRSKFIGNALVIRKVEEWREKIEKLHPNVKAELIVDGDLRGYEFEFNYPDIETFARAADGLYKPNAEKNHGISRRTGWFFDTYDFDFYFTTPPSAIPPEAEFMTQAAFNDVEFDLNLQLPNAAEKNNADEISADGKFLRWNLAPVLIHGGEKFMHAQFKIWHAEKIALTAAVELLFLAATIFFFVKARTQEDDDLAKDFRRKRNIFAGLAVALMIISVGIFFAPVNFTAADVISLAI